MHDQWNSQIPDKHVSMGVKFRRYFFTIYIARSSYVTSTNFNSWMKWVHKPLLTQLVTMIITSLYIERPDSKLEPLCLYQSMLTTAPKPLRSICFKYMHISDLYKLLPFIIWIIMKTKAIDSETVINFTIFNSNEITLNYLSFSYVVGRLCFLTR